MGGWKAGRHTKKIQTNISRKTNLLRFVFLMNKTNEASKASKSRKALTNKGFDNFERGPESIAI